MEGGNTFWEQGNEEMKKSRDRSLVPVRMYTTQKPICSEPQGKAPGSGH